MANAKQSQKPKYKQKTILAVQHFVNSRSWTDAKKIVEDNKQMLLTREADEIMNEMEAKYSRSIWGNEVYVIQEHRELLSTCRKDGIEAAFAGRVPKKR
jgi:hypothetical protein